VRLSSLTVTNFRSITKAHKLHFGNSTVLIGPNNEGKSNILRALVTAIRVLRRGQLMLRTQPSGQTKTRMPLLSHSAFRRFYSWESDFPIHQRTKSPEGKSEFVLDFEFDQAEIGSFKRKFGVKLSGKLGIKIALGKETGTISVSIQGPAAKELTAKAALIALFIAERIQVQYIPAIRTQKSAHEVVDDILESELQTIESDPKYAAALKEIEKLQAPVLAALSKRLKTTLKEFLPAIRDVKVRIAHEIRSEALRKSEIIIDDGNPTHLKYKGDGVQSLAALALMRTPIDSNEERVHTIVAIEEPESHLHPSAIHSLKAVLSDMATRQQVVITTHNPLFVDRARISSNIVVKDSKARSAKNVAEIRDILGVRASDNLRHAEIVLLVEGSEDSVALEALLPSISVPLRKALENGKIAIDTLNGGSNLSYKAGLVQQALCSCHCFLDNDEEGRKAFEKARLDGILTEADVNFVICVGMPDSEFEDVLDVDVYSSLILNRYRVSLESPKFKGNKKWSDRLKETFQNQGKQWSDRVESEVKSVVAEAVAASPSTALNAHKRASIDALVTALEMRISE
jgi:putative ATP-dependent endonuclease of OLD family